MDNVEKLVTTLGTKMEEYARSVTGSIKWFVTELKTGLSEGIADEMMNRAYLGDTKTGKRKEFFDGIVEGMREGLQQQLETPTTTATVINKKATIAEIVEQLITLNERMDAFVTMYSRSDRDAVTTRQRQEEVDYEASHTTRLRDMMSGLKSGAGNLGRGMVGAFSSIFDFLRSPGMMFSVLGGALMSAFKTVMIATVIPVLAVGLGTLLIASAKGLYEKYNVDHLISQALMDLLKAETNDEGFVATGKEILKMVLSQINDGFRRMYITERVAVTKREVDKALSELKTLTDERDRLQNEYLKTGDEGLKTKITDRSERIRIAKEAIETANMGKALALDTQIETLKSRLIDLRGQVGSTGDTAIREEIEQIEGVLKGAEEERARLARQDGGGETHSHTDVVIVLRQFAGWMDGVNLDFRKWTGIQIGKAKGFFNPYVTKIEGLGTDLTTNWNQFTTEFSSYIDNIKTMPSMDAVNKVLTDFSSGVVGMGSEIYNYWEKNTREFRKEVDKSLRAVPDLQPMFRVLDSTTAFIKAIDIAGTWNKLTDGILDKVGGLSSAMPKSEDMNIIGTELNKIWWSFVHAGAEKIKEHVKYLWDWLWTENEETKRLMDETLKDRKKALEDNQKLTDEGNAYLGYGPEEKPPEVTPRGIPPKSLDGLVDDMLKGMMEKSNTGPPKEGAPDISSAPKHSSISDKIGGWDLATTALSIKSAMSSMHTTVAAPQVTRVSNVSSTNLQAFMPKVNPRDTRLAFGGSGSVRIA